MRWKVLEVVDVMVQIILPFAWFGVDHLHEERGKIHLFSHFLFLVEIWELLIILCFVF
jgi:hypothetical protein